MRRNTTADQIKQFILRENLRPGDPLPTESELGETLDVSRSSVREAIRTLSTLDIVTVRHGHGTYVGGMSLDPMVEALVFRGVLSPEGSLNALREVVEVRLALDLSMAERVVGAIGQADAPALRAMVDEMVEKASRGENFLEADRAFHTTMFGVMGNNLAQQLVGAFWDVHTAVLPQLGLALPADMRQTAKAHGDMLEAALQGDVDAYRLAVVEHYQPLQRVLAAVQ
ncbi:GntR family transcriptional regulator [Microbacterium lacus]|uniref:FadR/GntR family transcriptional regulator n=1 Tax=Microbacterium lacus TaxID=415217 RepID=UPI00384DB58A